MSEQAPPGDAAAVTDYLRVKRKKTTIFLYVDLPVDTVHDLRAKVNLITKVPTSDVKFFIDRNGEVALDENKSLFEQKLQSDDEIFMIYRKEGSDEWEEIDIYSADAAKADVPPS